MTRTLAVAALLAVTVAPDASAQRRARAPQPEPRAQHVVILDGVAEAPLYCDDCETPIAPASMSKLMTVLIVLEQLQAGRITLDTRFTVSTEVWREHGANSGGSTMFLPDQSTVTVRDLLSGVIIVSANDACVVLAEGIAGSEEAFVAMMNRRAQELGLRTAQFRNATGVDEPGHLISTLDLARLARHLINTFPEFYRLYSQRAFTFNGITQENRNPILGAFAGADGMKTGHTDESGYGLIGSALVDGQRRIVVFNGLPSMAARRTEALRLMRSAFDDYSVVRLAAAGEQVGEARVRLGGRRTVPLMAHEDIVIGGPRGAQAGLSASIVYTGPLPSPVREGAVVAHLVVEGPNFTRQTFPLVAGRNVGRANWFSRAWEGLRLTLFGAS